MFSRPEEEHTLKEDCRVYKSNELIEGRYKLSVVAQKIAAAVIGQVNPTEKGPLPTFSLPVDDVSRISEFSPKELRKRLNLYTKELKAIVVEIRDTVRGDWVQLGLFRQFKFESKKDVLEIEFEDKLAPHIREFSGNFTSYRLEQIRKLSSSHGIRLYEILRMAYNKNRSTDEFFTVEYSVSDLKAMLGIKQSAYSVFSGFKRKVLDNAKTDLEENTDLLFDYSTERRGRKINSIRFTVRENPKNTPKPKTSTALAPQPATPPPPTQLTPDQAAMAQRLQMAVQGLPLEQARLITATHSDSVLTESLMELMQSTMSGLVDNPPRYFLKILKRVRKEEIAQQQKSDSTSLAVAVPRSARSQATTEELMDRSWADRYDFNFD